MKKTFLLIVACVFAFATVQAQSSEVEATTQQTKAEQFKQKNSFVKEETIYRKFSGVDVCTQLFTDLKSGEQLIAFLFYGVAFNGPKPQLGYLDFEEVDDLLLALETILNESNNSSKQDNYSISYTTPSGIDVYFTTESFVGLSGHAIRFSKKWYVIDDYGILTSKYSQDSSIIPVKLLSNVIATIKEAKAIANQALAK